MKISDMENQFVNSLVQDCITYRLTTDEALSYIQTRFKKISEACYKHRKARILSDDSIELWLNHFTRIGFIQHHKQQIDTIQMIQRDSIQQLHEERQHNPRDENIIIDLKRDIKENTKLLSELGLGTPIISAIKSRMRKFDRMNGTCHPSDTING